MGFHWGEPVLLGIFLEKNEEEKEIDRMYEFWYCLNIGYTFILCLPMVVSEVCENVQI